VRPIRSLAVFCGSSARVAEAHREAALRLGAEIARRGIRLVYGGGRIGLMGLLADAALAEGGEVVGVIPDFLFDLEVAHGGLTELVRVGSMHERKRRMFELADAFVAFSGGIGTLDETIEITSWKQLGLHDRPIVLWNVGGLWNPLAAQFANFVDAGFAHPEHARLFTIVESIDAVFEALATAPPSATPADAKWT
jgi:hypothetical protein